MSAGQRLLLALFPASFRRRFGSDLEVSLHEALQEASEHPGLLGRTGGRVRVWFDFVRTALVERFAGDRPSGTRPSGPRRALGGLLRDLAFAVRQLRRAPGFTLAVAVTIALGVGANVAVFSVLHGVLLAPLAYDDPEELVYIWGTGVSGANFDFWSAAPDPLEATSALIIERAVLSGHGPAEQWRLLATDVEFPHVLGVAPLHGRWFDAEELRAERAVVVLRDDEASRLFGSAAAAVGRAVHLDEIEHLVIGVMPREFATHFRYDDTRAWRPSTSLADRYTIVGRLRAGIRPEEAFESLAAQPEIAAIEEPRFGARLNLLSLHSLVVDNHRSTLTMLYAGVALVLALACVNVAHLFLVRTGRRVLELSIRASLGAGTGRLVRQLLIEAGCLVSLGSGLGLLAVPVVSRTLVSLAPPGLRRADGICVDASVLAYTAVVTVLLGLVCGLVPALVLRRGELHPGREPVLVGGRVDRRFRGAMMAVQVALALVVLGGASLLTRTLLRLEPSEPGFDPDSKLVFEISLPDTRYPDGPSRQLFQHQLLDALEAVPGIGSAEAVSNLPFGGTTMILPIWADGRAHETSPTVHTRVISNGYLSLMGVTTRRGRAPSAIAPEEAWINESAASVLWPDGDPLGRELRVEAYGQTYAFRVAGVLADTRMSGTHLRAWAEVFVPFAAMPYPSMTVVAHTAGPPERLLDTAAEVVRDLDPLLPIEDASTLARVLEDSVWIPRFNARVTTAFAVLTLALACVGIFGLVSHAVAARRRELGIRLAVGADARSLAALVLRGTLAVLALGLALGGGLLYLGIRWIESLLFGMPAADPAALGGSVVLLAVAALGAAGVPVARAARTDPTLSMRAE